MSEPIPAPATPRSPAVRGLVAIMAACGVAAPLTIASERTVLVGYKDPVGIVTACDGHTGPGAILGKRYSPDECKAFLEQDLMKAGRGIDACIAVTIPLQTRAAFTDFALNAGPGAYCRSTIARRVNGGDVAGGCDELLRWVYAGGRQLPGLVVRRQAERKLCRAGLGLS